MILFKQGPVLVNKEKIEYIECVSRFNEVGIIIKTAHVSFSIDTKIKSTENCETDILIFVYKQMLNNQIVDFTKYKKD